MKQGWQTANTATATTKTATTTKNFLSMSAQVAINDNHGPSLSVLLKVNSLHLAENLFRYQEFPGMLTTVGMIFRLLQLYCVFFMPGCETFWSQDTSLYTTVLSIPTQLCLIPGNVDFHYYLGFAFFLFYLISGLILFFQLRKPINISSIPNKKIFWFRLFFEVINPITCMWSCSCCGYCLKRIVFYGKTGAISYLSLVLQIISIGFAIGFHVFGSVYDRSSPFLNYDAFMVPLAPYVKMYSIIEIYTFFLGFIEEFLPLDQLLYSIIFAVLSIVLNNPFTCFISLKLSFYQNFLDTSALVTTFSCGFLATILILISFVAKILNPTIVVTIEIILFIGFTYIFGSITKKRISHDLKRLYSVYKYSAPVLPPTTPLVFASPQGLSRNAYDYAVKQKFSRS